MIDLNTAIELLISWGFKVDIESFFEQSSENKFHARAFTYKVRLGYIAHGLGLTAEAAVMTLYRFVDTHREEWENK